MPALFKMMSDEKQTVDCPAVVIAETQQSTKQRKTKKYVIIAVSAILGAAIILAAILVGMYMFTEAQKDILKYTLTFNNNDKQDVTSDPNTNTVQYHVSNTGQEAWIVNDFNKDIQAVKIQTNTSTNCYLSALNRSVAMDPTKITQPESNEIKDSSSLTYVISNTPIPDTSFLSKAARDMCKGISVYWVYPQCSDKTAGAQNSTDDSTRTRRTVIPCVTGCCRTICACYIEFYRSYSNGRAYCTWYYRNCPNRGVYRNPYSDYCSSGRGCPNRYPTRPPTC